MAIGDSAGLLFRIKADADQAKRELNSLKGEIGGLGGALNGLAAGAGGPAGLAAAGMAAVAAAAVTAAVGLSRLMVAASEYGSAIFDASQKTGLSTASLSALKYAADTSGSSLEAITGSVAKFNVLLGEANAGNLQAIATLEKYKITATDVDGALNQAIKTIAEMTDADQQAAAAKALFKDRTAAILPVIQSFEGDLPALIAHLEKLGLVLTEQDAKAADEFGDTLDTLKMQAFAVGRTFVSEFMPDVTRAMKAVSDSMADNKDVARDWGSSVSDTIRGVETTMQVASRAIDEYLNFMSYGLLKNASSWIDWSVVIRAAISSIFPKLTLLLQMMATVGRLAAGQIEGGIGGTAGLTRTATPNLGGEVGAQVGLGGGGGKGGGGKGGTDDPDRQRQEELQKLQADHRQRLSSYKAHLKETEAALKLSLSLQLIDEKTFVKSVGELKLKEILFEKQLNEDLLKSNLLNDEEVKALKVKQVVLDKELGAARKDMAREVYEAIKKEVEKELKDFEEAEKKRMALIKKRQEAILAASKAQREQREARDPFGTGRKKAGASDAGEGSDWEIPGVGDFLTGLAGGGFIDALPLMLRLGEDLREVFGQLANAVGQVVHNFILFGSAGTSFRKFAAEVIASVAQMAVVKAIFEAAEGLAMMGLFWFTNNPKFLKSAKEHFLAAAVYGSIGAVATGVGRAVAGNAFNQATGGGGGGGGGGNSSDRDPNAFGERFRGFGDQNNPFTRAADRMIQAIMLQEEATTRFMHQFGTASPGDVVMRVAESDPEIFGRANEKYLDESGGRGTERLMRRTGMAT